MKNSDEGVIGIVGLGTVFDAITSDYQGYGLSSDQTVSHPVSDIMKLFDDASKIIDNLQASNIGLSALFIAVDSQGLNHARLNLFASAKFKGVQLINLIHASALVSSTATLGTNIWVGPQAVISARCDVRSNVMVGGGVRLDAGAAVSEHTWIGAGCRIGEQVRIGKNCFLAADQTLKAGSCIGSHSYFDSDSVISGQFPKGSFLEPGYSEPAFLIGVA